MSECAKNVDLVYPEGPKRPSMYYPVHGLLKQTVQALDMAIARNRKELWYGD